MDKSRVLNKFDKGQVIPLVVLLLFAIISMAALILDGGAILSGRRTAQAAADAGALAGAQRACIGEMDAKAVAELYAINNLATSAVATVDGTQVTVNATVENPSFFAKIFGLQTLTARAEATAGCFGPRGKSVVPLAWNCKAPSIGGSPYDPDLGCQIQTLSWEDGLKPLVEGETSSIWIEDYDGNSKEYFKDGTNIVDSSDMPPEQIYIIIDSDKICLEDDPINGVIPCDVDGDGKKDIQLGGDRGWLYLTADTNSIAKWVKLNGAHPDFSLKTHIWLSGKSGNVVDVYKEMVNAGYPGQVVLIPVYNVWCDGDPRTDTSCVDAAHASPPWPEFHGVDDFSEIRNKTLNYHIVAFAPFYVSCVSTKGDCPGFRYAQSLPKGEELKDGPVVEGFFLTDIDVSPDSEQDCSIDLGNCVISLSN